MKRVAALLCILPLVALAQGKTESRELVGRIGSRDALMVLHGAQREDGGWHLTGEYILLPTLARRFLEGERGPQLGATSLKEGTTAILFGRDATGELRGTWRDGIFKGMRYGPGGQERERFQFSEQFASMQSYSASVDCQAREGRSSSTLAYAVASGQLKRFEWRSGSCTLSGLEQQPMQGGLRFVSGRCVITLREVGDAVTITAEDCAQHCTAESGFEPLLVDQRGNCRPLHAEAR